jgi:nucleotide-binding universal stress UspA family protein
MLRPSGHRLYPIAKLLWRHSSLPSSPHAALLLSKKMPIFALLLGLSRAGGKKTAMRTRLIVLIDFSPYAETLLQLAGTWSKLLDADIVLVHQIVGIVPAFTDAGSRDHILEIEKKEAQQQLAARAEKILPASASVSYQISEQSLLISLPGMLRPDSNDLVLVGLKGTGILKKIFIGSTATKIIEQLACITVAVPAHLTRLLPEKLIVSLNYKYPLHEPAFDTLLDAFGKSVKQLEFITVITPGDDETESLGYLQGLHSRYQQRISSSFHAFKGDDALSEIKAYVHHKEHSILVAQRGSRSLSDLLFRKFLVNELVHEGATPLIIIPA